MLDFYFKRPILIDYFLSGLISVLAWWLITNNCISVPKAERLFSTISDMSTIALTMAGFILTLSTVLISFKSTNKIDRSKIQESDKIFDLFFASKLYFESIKILNNAIKSLCLIALTGYLLKLMLEEKASNTLFLYCVLGITMIVLTVIRCVVILTSIVKLQENN